MVDDGIDQTMTAGSDKGHQGDGVTTNGGSGDATAAAGTKGDFGFSTDDADVLGEEGIISFNMGDDDGDDDDMADLFSFGAVAQASASSSSNNPISESDKIDYSAAMASVMPLPRTRAIIDDEGADGDGDNDSHRSDDSFLEMLEQQKNVMTFDILAGVTKRFRSSGANAKNGDERGDGNAVDGDDSNKGAPSAKSNAENNDDDDDDKATTEFKMEDQQEILDWLDEDESSKLSEELLDFNPPTRQKVTSVFDANRKKKAEAQIPEFKSLEDAVTASVSSTKQIRKLLKKEKFNFKASLRPNLWCQLIMGKSLEDVASSKEVVTYQQWESKEKPRQEELDPKVTDWVKAQSKSLSNRIADVTKGDPNLCGEAVCSVLLHQVSLKRKANLVLDETDTSQQLIDPILPPVVATLLSAGIAKPIAALLLKHISASTLPLLSLTTEERAAACQPIQRDFYLMAVYHLPLLCLHLDRHMPTWYEWTSSSVNAIPASWMCSNFCGDSDTPVVESKRLIHLWDAMLSSDNPCLHCFLILALLESKAEQLLLLTGTELQTAFKAMVDFKEDTSIVDGFAIEAGNNDAKETIEWVQDWVQRATSLWEATPLSIVESFGELPATIVAEATAKRREDFLEHEKQQQEAKAKAEQDALDAEKEKKAEEARIRLTRLRLVAYYRQYNPGKENNIEKIMKTYEGRYEVLDAKLKAKYGVSFNPALKPKPQPKSTNGLLSSMNQNITSRRKQFFSGKRREDEAFVVPESEKVASAVSTISASEVLRVTCWSKEANAASMRLISSGSGDSDGGGDGDSSSNNNGTGASSFADERVPLKYYLVDCRPEQAAQDQGRFPTAVALSPEIFLDADLLQQREEMIEPLRGTVHIVIMGEGYKTLPELYGQKMSQGLHEYVKEDESRNNLCALFFVKKGFPFVSIMEGGFAAAHAWLCRDGARFHLRASNVLTDYQPEVSLFGQFESLHQEQMAMQNASAKEKTQRAIQNLFDSSMVAITKGTKRFDNRAPETADRTESRPAAQKSMVSTFFRQSGDANNNDTKLKDDDKNSGNETPATTVVVPQDAASSEEKKSSGIPGANAFRNTFLSRTGLAKTESERSLEIESVEFGEDGDTSNPKPKPAAEAAPTVKLPTVNAFGNMFKATHDTESNAASATTSAPSKPRTFGGLGAALNSSMMGTQMKTAAIPINPFARFGKGAATAAPAPATNGAASSNTIATTSMANRFAGFNQLRKNTMARVRNTAATVEKQAKAATPAAAPVAAAAATTSSADTPSAAPATTETTETQDLATSPNNGTGATVNSEEPEETASEKTTDSVVENSKSDEQSETVVDTKEDDDDANEPKMASIALV